MRIGTGYDVHQLAEGLPLWLGGVLVPHTYGLVGHSDADVLLHAICDALLGAAALGDIGKHFPDTDPQYKGISSIKLLAHVGVLLKWNMYHKSGPPIRESRLDEPDVCRHQLSRTGIFVKLKPKKLKRRALEKRAAL